MAFGTNDDDSEIDVLPEEEVNSIFRKVYGLETDEEFMEDYIKSQIDRLKSEHLEPMEKIKRMIEDPRVQKEVKHLGVYGVKSFYKSILNQILGLPTTGVYFHNGTRANISTCSISDGKGNKKHSVFLYMQDFDNQICYIFSKRNRRMVSVTPEELYQMGTQSMVIKPAYTFEERNMQTDIIDQSMRTFIKRGESSMHTKEEQSPIDMDEFFVDDFEEEK